MLYLANQWCRIIAKNLWRIAQIFALTLVVIKRLNWNLHHSSPSIEITFCRERWYSNLFCVSGNKDVVFSSVICKGISLISIGIDLDVLSYPGNYCIVEYITNLCEEMKWNHKNMLASDWTKIADISKLIWFKSKWFNLVYIWNKYLHVKN